VDVIEANVSTQTILILPDLFISVKLGKLKEKKTKTIRKTNNPIFNESFEFDVKLTPENAIDSSSGALQIQLLDYHALAR
jgi:Ca2+-dependent lipid-binding protein